VGFRGGRELQHVLVGLHPTVKLNIVLQVWSS